jgi:hypothetical protein
MICIVWALKSRVPSLADSNSRRCGGDASYKKVFAILAPHPAIVAGSAMGRRLIEFLLGLAALEILQSENGPQDVFANKLRFLKA